MARTRNRLLPLLFAALLAAPVLAGSGLAAGPAEEAPLLGLWTPLELAGSDADRVIGPVGEPDLSPPEALAPLPARPAPTPLQMRGAIRRVALPAGIKLVALSFDLCERANNVAGFENRIVALLRSENARATFFAGGKWMRSHPEAAMQLMADPRFELGNHAWTHGNLALMTREEIRTQMRLTEQQHANLRAELGRRAGAAGLAAHMAGAQPSLSLMRLPYGRSSELALNTLADMGYVIIQWDVEGERDEEEHSPRQLADRILRLARPGSIILLHANAVPQKTYDLLRLLLPGLRKKGCRTATVGELLAHGRPEAVREGYFTVPGDNRKYDAVFPGKGTLKPDPARPFTHAPVP